MVPFCRWSRSRQQKFHFKVTYVCVPLFVIIFGLLTEEAAFQLLSSTSPDVLDGPCESPQALGRGVGLVNLLKLYNPFKRYYVNRGSRSFYYGVYEILNGGRSASTEAEVASIRPRAKFLSWRILRRLGDLDIYFDGLRAPAAGTWYGYRCLPSLHAFRFSSLIANPFTPFLNLTCTNVGGSLGYAPPSDLGKVYFGVLHSDGDVTTIWGCFRGQRNWHLISTEPELTAEQIRMTDDILRARGFNLSHAMDINYT